MSDLSQQTFDAICEIRDLLRLISEPQIAARDEKLRQELTMIVGRSNAKQKSVMLMDGNHTQADLHKKTGINKGHLSTLVKQLNEVKLLIGDLKRPKLVIIVPANFFELQKKR